MEKYADFKSFLMGNFNTIFEQSISNYINTKKFKDFEQSSLDKQLRILKLTIQSFHPIDDELIEIQLGFEIELCQYKQSINDYGKQSLQYFSITIQGDFNDGLTEIKVIKVEDNSKENFENESINYQFLLPHITGENVELFALRFQDLFSNQCVYHDMYAFPAESVMKLLNLKLFLQSYQRIVLGEFTLNLQKKA